MGFFDKKINSWAEKLERSINRLSEEMTSGLESFNVDGLLSSAMGEKSGKSTPPPLPQQQEGVDYQRDMEQSLAVEESGATAVDYLSPKMRGLINAAVRDGVVTEAELSVLVRKGAEEGMDADEVVMVTNARLFEVLEARKRNEAASQQPSQPSPRMIGKCPFCGAINPPGLKVCPECGKPLAAAETAPAGIAQLVAEVHRIDEEGEEQDLDESVVNARKRQAIMAFSMPTTPEGLYEFVETAIAEADEDYDMSSTWVARAKAALGVIDSKFGNTPGAKDFVRSKRFMLMWY